jgi:hypothetical protein
VRRMIPLAAVLTRVGPRGVLAGHI